MVAMTGMCEGDVLSLNSRERERVRAREIAGVRPR